MDKRQNTPMKIYLEFVAMLHVKDQISGSIFVAPDGSTVTDLLNKLEISPDHQRVVTAFINDAKVAHSHKLKDGDKVFLSIPISGG